MHCARTKSPLGGQENGAAVTVAAAVVGEAGHLAGLRDSARQTEQEKEDSRTTHHIKVIWLTTETLLEARMTVVGIQGGERPIIPLPSPTQLRVTIQQRGGGGVRLPIIQCVNRLI